MEYTFVVGLLTIVVALVLLEAIGFVARWLMMGWTIVTCEGSIWYRIALNFAYGGMTLLLGIICFFLGSMLGQAVAWIGDIIIAILGTYGI